MKTRLDLHSNPSFGMYMKEKNSALRGKGGIDSNVPLVFPVFSWEKKNPVQLFLYEERDDELDVSVELVCNNLKSSFSWSSVDGVGRINKAT